MKTVLPHPSWTGVDRELKEKYPSCRVNVSPGAIGTFKANMYLKDVGASVTGFERLSQLTIISGVTPLTIVELAIGVAGMGSQPVSWTSTVRDATAAACAPVVVVTPPARVIEHRDSAGSEAVPGVSVMDAPLS